eukprot:CAMPEP_0178948890 /NCGR_PEP_ID=MMETSP0789-20121207/5726_1 /TAXON_ID=3005 /ORGANISM="Rhizosolenia setigera, Strain CCMP 1694" /LENGTH=292 /DNA_ID=CAMNT_0020629311 /DNA_START=156 /DNA_END=1034 /DNA_ORIENTATION=+
MGAAIEVRRSYEKQTGGDSTDNQMWAIIFSALTFILTFIVVAMHLSAITSVLIIGTKLEGVLCVMLFAFWVSVVSIVSDSRNALAVDENGRVSNGNLYYFSWAGFICSITILVSYLRSAFNLDLAGEIRTRSARLNLWSGLLATSIVVTGSSVLIYQEFCQADTSKGGPFCHRTSFTIALGVIGVVFSLYVVGSKIATSTAPFLVEASLSILMMILYIFGVGFITSEYGPGATLGNLYYFTWMSFFVSFMLVASCFEDYQAAKAAAAQHDHRNEEGSGADEIHVQDFEDVEA